MTEDEVTGRQLALRTVRWILLAAGLAVFGLGLSTALVPGVERLLPIEAAIRVLGSDYVVVAVLGLTAIGLAALVVAARQFRGVDEADPPVVEGVQSARYPGADLDGTTDRAVGRWLGTTRSTERRERLGTAAVRTLMRVDGCSRTAAERRVARGTWTEDPAVARFLSEERTAVDGGLLDRLRRRSAEKRLVGRAVAAIDRLASDEDRREAAGSELRPRRPEPADSDTSTITEGASGGDRAPVRGPRAADEFGRSESKPGVTIPRTEVAERERGSTRSDGGDESAGTDGRGVGE